MGMRSRLLHLVFLPVLVGISLLDFGAGLLIEVLYADTDPHDCSDPGEWW